eukprot:1141487-Pelagomonas_calceolata.AAC.2
MSHVLKPANFPSWSKVQHSLGFPKQIVPSYKRTKNLSDIMEPHLNVVHLERTHVLAKSQQIRQLMKNFPGFSNIQV